MSDSLGLALDRPQVIEYDITAFADMPSEDDAAKTRVASITHLLANQDVVFEADADANLYNFFWPWADATYVRSIRLQVSAPREEAFFPMVTRFFPGHQETIYGSEGIIIGKQLVAPLKSNYDRSALWLLDCQAEGDRLLRIDVEIDWGEPLSQRMVDGLLVAQQNPGPARGIYQQQNAESTRVFGNPQGRPDRVDIDDPQRAHLVYHVLINGAVDVPLMLTVSDVGEQMAWNGFLSLREGTQVFEKSSGAWNELLHSGRLWTPDPALNHAVHAGRIESVYRLQRLRTGVSPTARAIRETPPLVDALDAFDLTQSRNLLAQMRRTVEKSGGRLPVLLPVRAKEDLIDPAVQLPWTNGAYLSALRAHLGRHFDAELLDQHYTAVGLCAEMLVRSSEEHLARQKRADAASAADVDVIAETGVALRCAVVLALLQNDHANALRWENAACDCEHLAEELGGRSVAPAALLTDWRNRTGWSTRADGIWHFVYPQQGIALAGQAVWIGCGLVHTQNGLVVRPTWPRDWAWWALLNLPLQNDQTLSLVWDGTTLHATQPVQSDRPVQVHSRIHTLNAGELDFDLAFEFIDELNGEPDGEPQRFKPQFIME